MTAYRLAIVASHPIQHFVHLYRALAASPDVTLCVFFCSRIGIDAYFDAQMQREIVWDGDLLEGYPHLFLPEAESIHAVAPRTVNNPSIAAELAAFRPTHVLVYGYTHLTALRALAWSRLRRLPVLMIGDGDAVPRPRVLRESLRKLVLRPLLSQVSAFLTVGDQNETFWRGLGVAQKRLVRSPFPIDEALYRHASANRAVMRAATRRRYGIAADAFVALFVGKFTEGKRALDLVDASTPEPSLHLLFCGDGAERATVEARTAERQVAATFAGFINLEQLPAHYAAADCLVIPSYEDHHPLVGSEACAVGLPLVVSDRVGLVGPTDIARPNENALVYPCGDTAALGLALARIRAERDLATRMGEASQAVFEQTAMRHAVAGMLRALDETGGGKRLRSDHITHPTTAPNEPATRHAVPSEQHKAGPPLASLT